MQCAARGRGLRSRHAISLHTKAFFKYRQKGGKFCCDRTCSAKLSAWQTGSRILCHLVLLQKRSCLKQDQGRRRWLSQRNPVQNHSRKQLSEPSQNSRMRGVRAQVLLQAVSSAGVNIICHFAVTKAIEINHWKKQHLHTSHTKEPWCLQLLKRWVVTMIMYNVSFMFCCY